ncbi:ACR229Wp [Eremothecium gossypii ATCC 10895]|uniref:Eukaryotic translation initiation factor 3 subunit J n=1 Tax=Eremothecium gossypii (strain ATCC 10895 / CBS 109.51 / FGSC 9923 / NRRL Y-1056) TaxID=284811 RepID=EIF3J_EREGS|nr:ACR229Wp [Eremothecium gossypii ATCC 10895]Q75BP2.1 RecName: Full=Eukaryotic translation initiation factor 3 subunit J; Short=eIF3j; AltName: Full=Eukaryotic translation initiation factor 3 30 kDa subunit; Short=eIF-3 30 kDa [Eremothecium gossypii ATCC 10895]AAS51455.1 ACR229Wp [Eremothecium gossypii ATCC 10895]
MSWDDEEFEVRTSTKDQPMVVSWDDEFNNDDDDALLESWDAEEVPKQKQKPKAAPKAAKKVDKKGETVLLEIDTLDEKTRKELLKKAELNSDLNNAAALFDGLGVAEEHPRARALRQEEELAALSRPAALTKQTPFESHPLFSEAETKSDFQDLRKALSTAIAGMAEKSSLNYSGALAIDLIRDVAKPLSIESIRQTVATLNVLIKEKERQERQARLAKVKGGTATGGAGKKKAKAARPNLGGAFKKDQEFSLEDNSEFADFGDDDFM